mmetsp:Transcript_20186/g.49495  ORF Transcript_20186/g.49495 Transcript_20186/m.49495 type:complete len:858 (-) Transcript_20186:300-2873(-)
MPLWARKGGAANSPYTSALKPAPTVATSGSDSYRNAGTDEDKEHSGDFDDSFQILRGRDIRELVFSFLDARSICNAARVSKAWYQSSSSQRLWHGLYTRAHGPAYPQGSKIVNWKEKFLEVDNAWETLVRSRRSILTFFGPESLALLIGAVLVVFVTFGLVANQHVAVYTYEPQTAYLHAWWIDRSVEEDSDSDELVVTYRLRLSLTQPDSVLNNDNVSILVGKEDSSDGHEQTLGGSTRTSDGSVVHAPPWSPLASQRNKVPSSSKENDGSMSLEDGTSNESSDDVKDGPRNGSKHRSEADLFQIPHDHHTIKPRFYPLSKDASGSLEEQLALLRQLHRPTAKMATMACAKRSPPPGAVPAPHPWRRFCGGPPGLEKVDLIHASIDQSSVGEDGSSSSAGNGNDDKTKCNQKSFTPEGNSQHCKSNYRNEDSNISVGTQTTPVAVKVTVFQPRNIKNQTHGNEQTFGLETKEFEEGFSNPLLAVWLGILVLVRTLFRVTLSSVFWTYLESFGGSMFGADWQTSEYGFLLKEYVIYPYFWLTVSASTALLTVACACRSDRAGTKPTSARIPRMEFEPVARKWAYRLLDSREVSQDRTRMVLAVALCLFHLLVTAPLCHLAFVSAESVEGGKIGGPSAFVMILLAASQLAAAAPTVTAWRAWRQAASIRTVRFYSVFGPHLRRGGNSRVLARVDARRAVRVTRIDFRLQCHETYLHMRRGRGGEMETSKRTRVLWQREYNVSTTPSVIVPPHPEVFRKTIELPATIRESSGGPPPYCTWFLACIIVARPVHNGVGVGDEQRIVHEVSVNIADEIHFDWMDSKAAINNELDSPTEIQNSPARESKSESKFRCPSRILAS